MRRKNYRHSHWAMLLAAGIAIAGLNLSGCSGESAEQPGKAAVDPADEAKKKAAAAAAAAAKQKAAAAAAAPAAAAPAPATAPAPADSATTPPAGTAANDAQGQAPGH